MYLFWYLTGLIPLGIPILYFIGINRSHGKSKWLFSWWRPLLCSIGFIAIIAALFSPIEQLADEFFFIHMIQHLLLQMIAVPLILLGTPIVPIMRGWPIKLRRSVIIKIMQNRIVRKTLWFLTRPLISLLAYSVLLWVWHLPNFYEAAIKHEAIHQLEHFTFLITSAIYWSVIIDPKPLQTYVAYSKRILIILAGAVQNIALGAYITIYPDILYPWYQNIDQGNFWLVTSPLEDQQLAGLIMWVPGTMMYLIALLILLGKLLSSEEKSVLQREIQRKSI